MVLDTEKKAVAKSMADLGTAIEKDVSERRLVSMPGADFENEVESLSNDILREIKGLKKRYYEEGFKDALKQLQAQQVAADAQNQPAAPAVSAVVVPAPSHSHELVEAKMNDIEQRLSDRVTALE